MKIQVSNQIVISCMLSVVCRIPNDYLHTVNCLLSTFLLSSQVSLKLSFNFNCNLSVISNEEVRRGEIS